MNYIRFPVQHYNLKYNYDLDNTWLDITYISRDKIHKNAPLCDTSIGK